jgi:hypothetical protein
VKEAISYGAAQLILGVMKNSPLGYVTNLFTSNRGSSIDPLVCCNVLTLFRFSSYDQVVRHGGRQVLRQESPGQLHGSRRQQGRHRVPWQRDAGADEPLLLHKYVLPMQLSSEFR